MFLDLNLDAPDGTTPGHIATALDRVAQQLREGSVSGVIYLDGPAGTWTLSETN